ncbi:MAG: S8 family peptidase [Terriglobales bacterium]
MDIIRRNRFLSPKAWLGFSVIFACLTASAWASGYGVLVSLNSADVAAFDALHSVQSLQLNPNRNLYLITTTDSRTDAQLLQEIETDPAAVNPQPNAPLPLVPSQLDGQSTASVLNGGTSGSAPPSNALTLSLGPLGSLLAPLLNPVGRLLDGILNPLLGSVLNLNISISGTGASVSTSTGVVNSAPTWFYGATVPSSYPGQPLVSQIDAGRKAYALSTGQGAVVALIDNGVDPYNPVLASVLAYQQGYNFYDNTPNWSAYSDLGDGDAPGSVLDGRQSTASVLNGQSTASVLNGAGTCAAEFGSGSSLDGKQSTASVLNGQSTASVLNGANTQATVVTELNQILACDPDFGHGTAVAGLIHLVAPNAKILPIKAFGPGGTADAATLYASITYAIDQHVNVINLSFSAPQATGYVEQAIEEAVNDGIVVVAAAGNSSSSAAVYPASDAGVIGAGAVDGTQAGFPLASYSNFNPGPGSYVDVDVAAPGSQLFTTYPGAGQIWATVVGTSFSTPLVAGEAAALVSLRSSGSAARALIESTSSPAITGDAQGQLGHGLIDVLSALRSASPSLFSWWGW